ncbi:MAG: ABC transporter permease [Gemmatimonadaceae bacterium]
MRPADVVGTALGQIAANKLRSFFTLLGIIVSVAFLVAVVAIIQGMNAYVKENLAGALIGANSFQVHRTPLQIGLFDDEMWERVKRRPRVTTTDVEAVRAALPEAVAVGMSSGWPTPMSDVVWRNQVVGDALVFGITPEFQVVRDFRFAYGRGLEQIDVAQRRAVCVLGADIADNLFPGGSGDAVGRSVRVAGQQCEIVGVTAPKGKVLGQAQDGFVLLPVSYHETLYGRRLTATIGVKLANAADVAPAMARAEEALRVARHLRPGQPNNFSIETADALVAFWKQLTRVLFSIIPAMVAIGIVVGGIVIMNIMLMSVSERTREIGIRKALGARARDVERQFLAEAIVLSSLGGVLGVLAGWLFALLVAAVTPLPARITAWSVAVALTLGASVGVLFGVYPARRAARLDPVTAMRQE